jgi:hypothetical protein
MDNFSWLVGIFEGEGWFGLRKKVQTYKNKTYTYYQPSMSIAMTDEDVIKRLSSILNQKNYRTFTPSGKNVKGENYKTAYRLTIHGSKSLYIAEKMEPFLSERRKEQIKYVRENYSRKTTYREGYTPVSKKQTDYGLNF